jgi:hypothetical protein
MPEETVSKHITIKAMLTSSGDWVLDVLAAPFEGKDSDGQWFDGKTNYMLDAFPTPVIIYHHGVMPGKQSLQTSPIVIGKSSDVEIKPDGVHVRVVLDKALEYARRVWEAAKKGLAVASSDSISHLARLDIGGKTIMYEKNRAGRIAVWPLAGLSLWDRTDENFQPASRYALALPAVKAIYREAGMPFPELDRNDTNGGRPYAERSANDRARINAAKSKAKTILKKYKEL